MSQAAAELPKLPHIDISIALTASELPPVESGAPPAWIKVTPRGQAQTRDGRNYSFTPETLVARFNADGIDVPADLNHALMLKGARGEAADAIGWAKELQARADGTYARMDWLPAGKTTLAAKTHRFVSPTFYHDADGAATMLHSIALLAAPALPMPALAGAGVPQGSGAASSIAEALGLAAGADEAACLAAIGQMRRDFVPVGLYADTVASLSAARADLVAIHGAARKEKIQSLLDTALKSRKIMPYQRAGYEALCQTQAGFDQVSMLIANMVDLLPPSGLEGRAGASLRDAAEDPAMLAARATRYRDAQSRLGVTLSQSDAVTYCAANLEAGR